MLRTIKTSKTLNKRLFALTFGALLAIAIIVAGAHSSGVKHALQLATTHQPERFSELYFNDQSHLPTVVSVQTTKQFSFHTANHEANATHYNYVVIVGSNNDSHILKSGSFTLGYGASIDVPVSYSLPKPQQDYQIIVELIDRPQQIMFRVRT